MHCDLRSLTRRRAGLYLFLFCVEDFFLSLFTVVIEIWRFGSVQSQRFQFNQFLRAINFVEKEFRRSMVALFRYGLINITGVLACNIYRLRLISIQTYISIRLATHGRSRGFNINCLL